MSEKKITITPQSALADIRAVVETYKANWKEHQILQASLSLIEDTVARAAKGERRETD